MFQSSFYYSKKAQIRHSCILNVAPRHWALSEEASSKPGSETALFKSKQPWNGVLSWTVPPLSESSNIDPSDMSWLPSWSPAYFFLSSKKKGPALKCALGFQGSRAGRRCLTQKANGSGQELRLWLALDRWPWTSYLTLPSIIFSSVPWMWDSTFENTAPERSPHCIFIP